MGWYSNIKKIKKSTEIVNWEAMFAKKNIHEQFPIFNKVLTNVFSRFTTNEIVNLKDKDPPWRNEFMESKIK